jgi:enoyl-CoA hydratase/carnithine racemase
MSTEQLRTLRYEIRDAGAWIIFTRPERRNALDSEMIADLQTALRRAAADHAVRAVVITGAGGAFCSGANLEFVRSLDGPREVVDEFLRPLTCALDAIRRLPKPVIAAVNGHCVAGGMEMILCCDLILAASDARIADGHARLGLLPAIGGAQGLAHALGPHKAKELLFTGDAYTGAQLAELNLINRAVPAAELESAAADLVTKLAARSPAGLARMKQMVNDESSMSWDLAARYELTLTEAHLRGGAHAEGLAAFAEKRPPRFEPGQ